MTAVHTVAGSGQSWQVQSTGTESGRGGQVKGWGRGKSECVNVEQEGVWRTRVGGAGCGILA